MRQGKPITYQTPQELQNQSFDRDYQVNVVEPVVYNPETESLDRMVQPGTVAKQDEIITHLPLNDENRLKVSTLPGMPEVCSGVLTTTAAAATEITGTGCVGGTAYIAVDVSRASNVMFSLQNTGTVNMAAGQFAIEASLDSTNGTDGTWIGIQAVRSNANTIVTNTGTLTANVGLGPGFGFEASVNANMWFRLRVTTNVTTGAAAKWTILRGAYATEPIPAAQASSTQAVSLAAAATAIAKAEDSASASANVGVPPMVVRADTLQANAGTSANGDYAFMFCDVDGRVYTNSMITGKTSDTTFQTPRIDASTHTLQTIDCAHHEVHSGSSFYYHDVVALGNAGIQDYLITVPDTTKWPHFGIEIDFNEAAGVVEIYEATDKVGTTPQTVFNRDRNSATIATTTVHKGQSGGTTDGTRIFWKKVGAGKTSGGVAGTAEERILKRNTKYILRLTNTSTSTNNTTVVIRWYEHTNLTA